MTNYFILETIYTIETAAELLKCNPRVLRENVRTGVIKGHKKIGKWYLLHSDIVKFIASDSTDEGTDD
jgi:excisionase family DNA binding protein